MADGDGENPNKERVIHDHVLCALFGWFESSAKDDVKKLASSVFSFEEIKEALIKFCDPVTVIGTSKPKNLQKSETCFDEIWSQWEVLHKSKSLPKVVVDSAGFLKLPMVRPGESRSEVSTFRIAALESMVFTLVNQNKAILDTVEDLKKKVVTPLSYAKSVLNKEVSLGNNRVPDPKVQSQNVPRGRLSSNNQRFFRDRSESSKRKRLDADLDSGKNDSQMQVDDTQNEQKDGWNTVKDAKKLRSRGPKVVRSTSGLALGAGSNNFRQGWRAAPREIFVYHTHYSTHKRF